MKVTLKRIALVCIVLFTTASLFAVVVDKISAWSSGGDIIVKLWTSDETGVQGFVVLRRAGTEGDFQQIGVISQLKGNNSSYEYVDESVFKASAGIYQYRIRIMNGQTPAPETDIVTVSHVSSTARRTWGSIKAMFR